MEKDSFEVIDRRKVSYVSISKKLFIDNLSKEEILIYLALDSFRNQATGKLFPGSKKLIKRAQVSRNRVFFCLNQLEKKKIIRIKREEGRVNKYILLK